MASYDVEMIEDTAIALGCVCDQEVISSVIREMNTLDEAVSRK